MSQRSEQNDMLTTLPLSIHEDIYGQPCLGPKELLAILPRVCRFFGGILEEYHDTITVLIHSTTQLLSLVEWVSKHGHRLRSISITLSEAFLRTYQGVGSWNSLWNNLRLAQIPAQKLQHVQVHAKSADRLRRFIETPYPGAYLTTVASALALWPQQTLTDLSIDCQQKSRAWQLPHLFWTKQDLLFLPQLTALQSLSISLGRSQDNNISSVTNDITALSSLDCLSQLTILAAPVATGLVQLLQSLPKLQSLMLHYCWVPAERMDHGQQMGPALGTLRGLTSLSIDDGAKGTLAHLSNLRNLRHLHWNSTEGETIMHPLPSTLESLSYNEDVKGDGNNTDWVAKVALLQPLTNLTSLDISVLGEERPGIVDKAVMETLAGFKQLQVLHFYQMSEGYISPEVARVSALTGLTELMLFSVEPEPPGMALLSVLTTLTGLHSLMLNYSRITDAHVLAVSANLKELTKLDISDVAPEGEGVITLGALASVTLLTKLQQLKLEAPPGADAELQALLPQHLRK